MRLALEAAEVRHEAAFKELSDVAHLFEPNLQMGLSPSVTAMLLKDLTDNPIATVKLLEERLVETAGKPQEFKIVSYASGGTIEMKMVVEDSKASALDRAKVLAWGYLEAEPGKPVFPYMRA